MNAKTQPPAVTKDPVVDHPVVEPKDEGPEVPAGHALCRVIKNGAGQIHTGRKPGETYKRGEVIVAPIRTARVLEDRGFVETGLPEEG